VIAHAVLVGVCTALPSCTVHLRPRPHAHHHAARPPRPLPPQLQPPPPSTSRGCIRCVRPPCAQTHAGTYTHATLSCTHISAELGRAGSVGRMDTLQKKRRLTLSFNPAVRGGRRTRPPLPPWVHARADARARASSAESPLCAGARQGRCGQRDRGRGHPACRLLCTPRPFPWLCLSVSVHTAAPHAVSSTQHIATY
jgi:hypothetical protein